MPDDLGLSPKAAVLAFGFGTPAPATPAPAAPTAAQPAPTSSSPVGPQGEITAADAGKMISWVKADLAAGKISAEQADKIFSDLNVPLDQRVTPPDTRTDEQKLIDQQFFPAKESEYILPMYPPGQAPAVIPKEVQAFEANSRAWLAGAEFPRDLGNSLITTISKVAQQTKAMTPGQLESYRMVQHEQLQRAHGEKLGERLQAADDMIDWLEDQRPGLKQVLGSVGVGRNAMIWNMLIGQAERWHARRKGR